MTRGRISSYRRGRKIKADATLRTLCAMGGLAITMLLAFLFSEATPERRRLSSDDVQFKILEDVPGLAVVVYSLVLILFFIALAGVTDDYFVPSLAVISARLSLTEDVAGATFMAAGSSAPELFTSLVDVLFKQDSIGIGTIVGSAVFNILVIIACSGAFATTVLIIDWRPFVRDCSFYAFSILLLLIFIKLDGSEGKAYWWEGLIMVACYGIYIFIMWKNPELMECLGRIGGVPEKNESSDEQNKSSQGAEMVAQKPKCAAKITMQAADANQLSITVAMFDTFQKMVKGTENLISSELNLELNHIKIIYIKDEKNPDANMKLHSHLTNLATQAAVESGISVKQAQMEDLPTSGSTPSVIEAGVVEPEPKKDDSDSEDEPWPGPLRYLQILVGGVAKCWDWFFSWTVPGCNTEDDREDWEKMPEGDDKNRVDAELREREKWYVAAFVCSVLWIAILSYVMVDLADRIGKIIGWGSVLMGLTVLAAGTSIPDALSSVATAKRGKGDMAVANAIGSNVFDILLGLGIPWAIYGAIKGGDPYVVQLDKILTFVIILFATLILTVLTFVVLKWRLGPRLGQLLLFLYAVFFALAIIIARDSGD